MRLYRRVGETTVSERVTFAPFLLLTDPAPLAGARGVISVETLAGPGQLRSLARFASWADALAARDRCRGMAGGEAGTPLHFPSDPAHQFLLLSGRTAFRDLPFTALR